MNATEHAEKTIVDTRASAEAQEQLVNRVSDARKALEICATSYKQAWAEWLKVSEAVLPEFRSWRMAMDSELTHSLKSFGEVRKFFLSPDHDKEIARLREFVELCERLKQLKEAGFLDKVTDTILRLEIK